MKKTCMVGFVAGICGLTTAVATTITAPSALDTLTGGNAYEWGIGIRNIPAGEVVTSAAIDYNNVVLTKGDTGGTGMLFTDLLNARNGANNVTTTLNASTTGDHWAGFAAGMTSVGQQPFTTSGSPNPSTIVDLSYTLTAGELTALNTYLDDDAITATHWGITTTTSYFAIGVAPDCEFQAGDITFTYTLGPKPLVTPAPDTAATVVLLGASLLGLEMFRRKYVLAIVQA